MEKYRQLIFEKSFVNGDWITLTDEKTPVCNPADGTVIGYTCNDGRELVAKAVDAAQTAFSEWKNKTAKERYNTLSEWYRQILLHKEELAYIMSLECGKPLAECRGEVDYGASFVQWFAEEAKRNNGTVIPGYTSDRRISVIRQPVGVVGALTPWNFPLAMITRKIAPALAVGCTTVIRPSEATPFTALALAALAEKSGFPKGVINVVVGEDASEMGKELCENPKVAKISFTGSTRVGKILMKQCSDDLKKLSLELGGNAPFIVFADADVDAAVEGALAGKFRFSGQTCVCVNRILVQDEIYDVFVEKFVQKVSGFKTGRGTDDGVNFGPLINAKAMLRMEEMVADALKKGGKVVLGGKKINNYFFAPTVIVDATQDMRFSKEEIFGPIAPVFRFNTEEEAVAMANDTEFGLASYFYTNDLNRTYRVSEALQYGMVGINEGLISTEVAPFGGIKHSGQGREGSVYGLDDFVELKYICTGNVR